MDYSVLKDRSEFIYIHNLCVRAAMILASLCISGRCVEMMLFNGSMNMKMEVFTVRFRHLSHMLSHYVQLSSGIHARLFGSMQ